MRVDGVSGHGEDGTVQLAKLLHPVGEGSDGLRVDEVHRVEHQADILLALVVLQPEVSDVAIHHRVGGEVYEEG